MGVNEVKLVFGVDSKEYEAGLRRVQGQVEQTRSKMQSFTRGAKVASAALLTGLAVAAKHAFEGLKTGEQVSAQTAAALKSTGKAANVSQKQIEAFALRLSQMSGVDDELIQKGQNLLLTFTNIQNKAGKGNAIFNQATKTMLDMSVALGQDTKSSAIQLGKALNNPLKGVSALQKVGVSFTDAQKKQIKALVESGQTMKAQKIILAELNKEFGGSAKAAGGTMAGQIERAKQSFERASEAVLSALLPALVQLSTWLQQAGQWAENNQRTVKILVAVLGGLAASVWVINGAYKAYKATAAALKVVQLALNASFLANPIVLVIAAIVALGAAFVIAYKKSETFRNIVNGVFSAVTGAAKAVLSWFQGNWKTIAVLISGPFAPLVALATNAFGIRSALINAFQTTLSKVKGIWSGLTGAISAIGTAVYNAAVAVGNKIVNGAVDGIKGLAGMIKRKAEEYIREGLSKLNPFSPVEHGGQIYIGEPIVKGAIKGMKPLKSELKAEITEALRGAISAAKDYATSQASNLSSIIGQTLDVRAATGIANVDKSAEAQRMREIENQLKQNQILKEKARLEEAVAKAKTPAAIAQAQADLATWQLEQDRDTLAQSLQDRKDAIQAEFDARKAAVERSITDLTDALNRGLITQQQYTQQVVDALQATGVDYEMVGKNLGDSFANGFRDALNALLYEAGRIPELLGQERAFTKVPVKKAAKKKKANGGFVNKPETTLLGEAGPELVLPLTRPKRMSQLLSQAGFGGGPSINIENMTVRNEADIYSISSQLGRQLRMGY